jgi:hypothetical protein
MLAINDSVQRVFGLFGEAHLGFPDPTIAPVSAIRLLESNRTRCELNGCPRRDPRQNIASLDALRKGEELDGKIESGPPAEALVVWERFGSLGGSSQGPFMGRAIKGGEGSFMRGNR